MDQIVVRLPVSLWTTFLNFIIKPKGFFFSEVNRKLSEKKDQGKVGQKKKKKNEDIFSRMPLIFEKLKWPLDQRTRGQGFINQLPLTWDQLGYSRYIQSCLNLLFRKCSPMKSGSLIFIFLFIFSLMTLNFWLLCRHNSPSSHRGHPHKHEVTWWDTI